MPVSPRVRHAVSDVLVLTVITLSVGIVEYYAFGLTAGATARIRLLSLSVNAFYGVWHNLVRRWWCRSSTLQEEFFLVDAFTFAAFNIVTYLPFLWWNGATRRQLTFVSLSILVLSIVVGPLIGWGLTTAHTWSDRLARSRVPTEVPEAGREVT